MLTKHRTRGWSEQEKEADRGRAEEAYSGQGEEEKMERS
jgi:hypothetical protein